MKMKVETTRKILKAIDDGFQLVRDVSRETDISKLRVRAYTAELSLGLDALVKRDLVTTDIDRQHYVLRLTQKGCEFLDRSSGVEFQQLF